jgi:hypothetical protein
MAIFRSILLSNLRLDLPSRTNPSPFSVYAIGRSCVGGRLSKSIELRTQSWHSDSRFIQQMTCACWRKSAHGRMLQSK